MSHPTVAAFVAACLIPADHDTQTLSLNAPYREWCAINGLDPIGYPPLAAALDHEVLTARRRGRKVVVGHCLRDDWKWANRA